MKKTLLAVLTAVGAIAAAPVILADDSPVAKDDAQSVSSEQQATSDGLRAVRDKKTGKFRAPNANELKEMEEAAAAESAAQGARAAATTDPVVVRNASGMRSARLGPEYLISLQGKRNGDGTIEKSHDDGAGSDNNNEKTVAIDDLPTE